MTRVPKVQEIVSGILRGDVKELLLLDVTPLSLGIETLWRDLYAAYQPKHNYSNQQESGLLDCS
uniref:Uncharacterized protein n=1 Tax=Musa acuminata subsp. malaccensis TaxID=214687 RepID=A0A804JJA9_MUSAM